MKNVILEYISFYENAVFEIEKMIIDNVNPFEYEQNRAEREKIRMYLQSMLSKNYNLRKKDFELLMHNILFDIEETEKEIKSNSSLITKKVKDYLEEQKYLVKSLRLKFAESSFEQPGIDEIRKLLDSFKEEYEKKATEIVKDLKSFEQQYQAYKNKHNIIMNKLQRLVNKGNELQVKDLKENHK